MKAGIRSLQKMVSQGTERKSLETGKDSLIDGASVEQTALTLWTRHRAVKKRAAPHVGCTADALVCLVKVLLESRGRVAAQPRLADSGVDVVQDDACFRNRDLLGEVLSCHGQDDLADRVAVLHSGQLAAPRNGRAMQGVG